jgi:hypothetical protein
MPLKNAKQDDVLAEALCLLCREVGDQPHLCVRECPERESACTAPIEHSIR